MWEFDHKTVNVEVIGDIEVGRWKQYQLGDLMPFDAMWYVVPPGSTTPMHSHPELELSIVASGSGIVTGGEDSTEIRSGRAFLLASDENHTVHNPSTYEPLVVFSAYWMPGAMEAEAGGV